MFLFAKRVDKFRFIAYTIYRDKEREEKEMTKVFIYNVNGTLFEDTEAFGQAWKNAKAFATEKHTVITRTVICGNDTRNEFFARGGCFLNERFYEENRAKVF